MTRRPTALLLALGMLLTACGGGTLPRTPRGTVMKVLDVTSSAYADRGRIPAEYAASAVTGGRNLSVPLAWTGAPSGTKSFALTVIDTHPIANDWVHWMVTGLPPATTGLAAGASGSSAMPTGAVELVNSAGAPGWGGPMPPSGSGEHDYVATVYALDTDIPDLGALATLGQFDKALVGHVLAQGSVTGRFSR